MDQVEKSSHYKALVQCLCSQNMSIKGEMAFLIDYTR